MSFKCEVCLAENLTRVSKRKDDPEGIWYCQKCAEINSKRIWNLKRKEALKESTAIVKRDK